MRPWRPLTHDHDLVLGHGNGPQVGLLALESARNPAFANPAKLVGPVYDEAASLRARSFPAGSMGPKIEAACRFVEATGKMAAIGRLADAKALLDRKAGAVITL